ncbi:platelet-activating factor acetylhydrolase IB subunit [Glaciecola siphonariae]|uniref:Platelet-activating factor acetylhydrolase IB subunit n=1 Tax=Glaciecola siphonariae TaxID=521012 RepID=A0ABV9LY18_9ALTE
MPKFITKVLTLMLIAFSSTYSQATTDNDSEKDEQTPLSVQATVHTAEWAVDWWLPRHQQKLDEVARRNGEIDLIFLGDSITHNWESKAPQYWQTFYQHRKALNLGFGGDRTEHVLWRLRHGAVDGLDPKLVVLMIGTNNTGHRQDAAEDTALGVKYIIDELKQRLPNSKILLLAIFPRGESSDDPLRILNEEVNQLIKAYSDNDSVFWLNINHLFLDESGDLSTSVMNDLLHPETPQYKIWAQAIEPYVVRFVDGQTRE